MYMKNIREVKKNLRVRCRRFRERIEPEKKARMDEAIQQKLQSLPEYAAADVLLTYVSKPIEVDTSAILREALAGGKRVAVPRCLPETTGLEFYEIASSGDLEPGCYGVLEPVLSRCRPVGASRSAVCIVPGLGFDSQGYRLGYGKGYYDRFLARFRGVTVGLCYSGCTRWDLPHGYFDRPVDILVTERYIRRISEERSAR
jgi:5-formyltetrahydrofolate cyclo-ligase